MDGPGSTEPFQGHAGQRKELNDDEWMDDRTQFYRNFQTVAESAGLPVEKRHPHVLKHSLASHLVAGNANLALVRQALGHRSINSTMQYIGTSDSQAAEALQKALMGLF